MITFQAGTLTLSAFSSNHLVADRQWALDPHWASFLRSLVEKDAGLADCLFVTASFAAIFWWTMFTDQATKA